MSNDIIEEDLIDIIVEESHTSMRTLRTLLIQEQRLEQLERYLLSGFSSSTEYDDDDSACEEVNDEAKKLVQEYDDDDSACEEVNDEAKKLVQSYPLRELTMQKLIETAEANKQLGSRQSLFCRIPKKLYDTNASTSDPLSYPLRELTMQKLIETAFETNERPVSSHGSCCPSLFFRIPKKLYDTNQDVYRPQHFSLGPVHHVSSGLNSPNVDLKAMERIKNAAMLRLLKDGTDEKALRNMKGYVAEKLDYICNNYYGDNISQELVGRIVLVDACFVIDFFHRIARKASSGIRDKNDYSIFWYLRRDAVLVENQLPFFLIWELLKKIQLNELLSKDQMCLYMWELVRLTPFPPSNIKDALLDDCPHLLEFIMKCHLSVDEKDLSQNSNDLPIWFHLQSATQLNAAGVRFQSAEGGNILALEFDKGLLRIPALFIHDSTETLLVNLLAYERLEPNRRSYLASYVLLMSHLVETKKDLEFLQKEGIIVTELGSRVDGSMMFHNISTQALPGPFYFQGLWKNIEVYVNSHRRRYFQDLKRRYFRSPWTAISLFAAAVLLILTTLQTIYTIIPFYKKDH